MKTLADDSADWEKITARLIEDHHALRTKRNYSDRTNAMIKNCSFCKKWSHIADHCLVNPKSPNNSLQLKMVSVQATRVLQAQKRDSAKRLKSIRKTRVTAGRDMTAKEAFCERMMLKSGTKNI